MRRVSSEARPSPDVTMKVYGISDLHLANRSNGEALERMPEFPDDWLLVAGDLGEMEDHLKFGLAQLTRRFKRVVWVPGNHDLWSLPVSPDKLRGEAKYRRLVAICREFGVLTPEDPYVTLFEFGQPYTLVPMFLLYDYSFRPDHVPVEMAVEWAAASGVVCTDEELLRSDPYGSAAEWCKHRCDYTEERIKAVTSSHMLVLINHFPLRMEMAYLRRFPRFSVWCGTKRTEDWHQRFRVGVVVYGHMHIRGVQYRDGIRFEEVSLGYPRDWDAGRGIGYYLREILPGPVMRPC